MTRARKNEKMTFRDAILVDMVRRYLRRFKAVGVRSVQLPELHALLYFVQEVGIPLDLRFVRKASFGVYTEDMPAIYQTLLDHLVVAASEPGLVLRPGAVMKANRIFGGEEMSATRQRLDLVEMMIGYGPVLMSILHWTLFHEGTGSSSLDEIAVRIHGEEKDYHRHTIRSGLRLLRVLCPLPPSEKITDRDRKWARIVNDLCFWPAPNWMLAEKWGVSPALVSKVCLFVEVVRDRENGICVPFIARRRRVAVEVVEAFLKKRHLYDLGRVDPERIEAVLAR